MDGEEIMGCFSQVFDRVSDVIGTGGGDQGLLNAIDEGVQSVGGGLAEVDDFVNEEIPGGWYTVGAVALGGAGLAGGLGAGAGLTAAETAALAESSALADTAMAGAGGVGAGATGAGTVGAIASAIPELPMTVQPLASTGLTEGATLGGQTLGSGYVAGTGTGLTGAGLGATGGEIGTGILTGGGTGVGLGTGVVGTGAGLGLTTPEVLTGAMGLNGLTEAGLAGSSLYNSGITGKDVVDTLRAANTAKNVVKALTPQEQIAQKTSLQNAQATPLQNAQTSQQQTNMANVLRGTQMPQTALPPIYKQANPFNFGQQNQPVQDTTALANLLRTA
jgi:hypothetical protein